MTSINSDFMSQLALRSLGNSSNMMTQAMLAQANQANQGVLRLLQAA